MQITLADIQKFLETNPTEGQLNPIIYAIEDYRVNLRKKDRLWKRHLPYQEWGDLARREIFRDIFLQLRSQGVKVKHSPDWDSLYNDGLERWTLTKGEDHGILFYSHNTNIWTLHGFRLTDKNGNDLSVFHFVLYPDKNPKENA